jgi:hypothetical protein
MAQVVEDQLALLAAIYLESGRTHRSGTCTRPTCGTATARPTGPVISRRLEQRDQAPLVVAEQVALARTRLVR